MTRDTLGTQTQLETAINNQDFDSFKANYTEYLRSFPEFDKAFKTDKGPNLRPITSPLFGKDTAYFEDMGFAKRNDDGSYADPDAGPKQDAKTKDQSAKLLKNAREASNVFGSLSTEERLRYLKILSTKIDKYKDDIITTIVADTGKPINLAVGEMGKGGAWFKFAEQELAKQMGESAQSTYSAKALTKTLTTVKPIGAVQVMGAYNYPYALAIGGIVGALATGNGLIVTAPSKAPNWILPFMEAAKEAATEFQGTLDATKKAEFGAIKDKLVQYTVGRNEALSRDADLVHFVGGDYAGKLIGESREGKKTILEMGGSNVVTVLNDAVGKVGTAEEIAGIIYGGFGPATGQRCTAPRILCVQTGEAQQVADALMKRCKYTEQKSSNPFKVGNPFSKEVEMGPLVDGGAYKKMQEAIAFANELGAEVSGELQANSNIAPLTNNKGAYWVNPVVIDWSKIDLDTLEPAQRKKFDEILSNEIFGPLMHIIKPVKDLNEAIGITNKLDSHGLAAALFTDPASEDNIVTFARGIKATSKAVNAAPKDVSPDAEHGHPGYLPIGGPTHFHSYIERGAIMLEVSTRVKGTETQAVELASRIRDTMNNIGI
jgi:aldehyde dehydrogenase (NAD+)